MTKSMASTWTIISSNLDIRGDHMDTKIWRILTRVTIAAKFLNFFCTTFVAFLNISPTQNGWHILFNDSPHERSWVESLMYIIFHSQVAHTKKVIRGLNTHTYQKGTVLRIMALGTDVIHWEFHTWQTERESSSNSFGGVITTRRQTGSSEIN